jgi:succinate-semialdehyde dehydrogenase/glutarate-semialdehyde dehydrogenase
MKVDCDEVFGPVLVLKTYDDISEAIAEANKTPWGLKAGVFTGSLDVAMRAATELEYGTVNINGASRSRVDQEPSGGVKLSGWGKEGPRHAIREMTNVRMISLAWR